MRIKADSAAVTVLLTALVAVTPLSIDMPLPALPDLGREYQAGSAGAQLIISVFILGFAVSQLLQGPLSDAFGRRPVLLGGLGLYLASSLLCMLAPTMELLIAARFIQGFSACAAPVVARAIVRDAYEGTRAARVFSIIAAGMGIAPVIAPTIGGFVLIWFGASQIFALLAGTAAVLLLAVLFVLPETNARRNPGALRPGRFVSNYLLLLRHPTFRGYVAVSACASGGLFAYLSGSSFVLIDVLEVPAHHFGLYFALVASGHIAGALCSGTLAERLGSRHLLTVSTTISAAAGLTMATLSWSEVETVSAIVAPMCLYMFGFGITQPNCMAGAVNPFPQMAGAASAMMGFLQMTSSAAVGALVGHLHDGTTFPMAGAIALMAVLTAATFLAFARRDGESDRPERSS